MSTHLPFLLNPLLNAIFNNSSHNKAPFKDTIKTLSANHTKYTILVPPTQFLINEFDSESGVSFKELCYHNEEFIQSHVIRSDTHSKIYTTLNDKQILIKKDSIFTGRGFKKSLKLDILTIEFFKNFADYFPKGSEFMLIFIAEPLLGSKRSTESRNGERANVAHVVPSIFSVPSDSPITFERILRQFPLTGKTISEDFRLLFNNFQVKNKSLASIKEQFIFTINKSHKIFQNLDFNLVQNILDTYPSVNLNQALHDYIEINVYDKLWFQILSHIPDNLSPIYPQVHSLSLNQAGIPLCKPWEFNKIYKHIDLAITEFNKISSTGYNSAIKIKILTDTFQLLSNVDDLIVDADTLVGLLLIVIVHSQVKDLPAHIYYIKNFNYIDLDIEGGFLSYVISTLEAVIFHLEDSANLKSLSIFSQSNQEFWDLIKNGDVEKIHKQLIQIQDGNIKHDHYVKSVNPQGESCLMMAVQTDNYEVFKALIEFINIFQLEDILLDRTISGTTLLSAALQQENQNMIEDLIDIISQATLEEQIYYYNIQDMYQRNIGHYSFHYQKLIHKIGHLIDWTQKDLNFHTPLFTICRSYDHMEYTTLVKDAFISVERFYRLQNRAFDLDEHIDGRGNTLLHVLQNSLPIILKYDTIDVNKPNVKSYPPLTVYSKFNRYENIECILNDPRLDFMREDKNAYNIFDFINKNPKLANLIYFHYFNNFLPAWDISQGMNIKKIAVLNGKYDQSIQEWKLLLKGCERKPIDSEGGIISDMVSENWYSVYQPLSNFRKLYSLIKLEFPNSFLPDKSFFWVNFPLDSLCLPIFTKLKVNKMIHLLNIFFISLIFNKTMSEYELHWEFLIAPSFFKLETDLLHRIKSNINNEKAKHENLNLKKQQINEIEFFLNFSLNDLRKFQILIAKFTKLITFTIYKNKDVKLAWNELFHNIKGTKLPSLNKIKDIIETQNDDNDKSYDDFASIAVFMDWSIHELINKINELLGFIDEWWFVHNAILENDIELQKYERNIPPSISRRGSHASNLSGRGSIQTEGGSTSNGTGGTLVKQSSMNFNISFPNLLENKRVKYKKLLTNKSELNTKILEINQNLKYNHELIALEINNFISFKPGFIKFGIKNFVLQRIRILKFSRSALEKGLQNFRVSEL